MKKLQRPFYLLRGISGLQRHAGLQQIEELELEGPREERCGPDTARLTIAGFRQPTNCASKIAEVRGRWLAIKTEWINKRDRLRVNVSEPVRPIVRETAGIGSCESTPIGCIPTYSL